MEKIETLHAGNFRIIQDTDEFRFGIDAVLLADFASFKKNSHVVDLCTGNGIVPLLMAARVFGDSRKTASSETVHEPVAVAESAAHQTGATVEPSAHQTGADAELLERRVFPAQGEKQPKNAMQPVRFTGVEINHHAVDMARRSVVLNNLEKTIEIVECDIKNVFSALPKNCADVVTANPPYMPFSHGKKCPSQDLAAARHEVLCCLENVVLAAAGLLNSNGRFFMIHRPERLAEIMESLVRNELEPKRLRFIHPYESTPPTMVLIEAKKCAAHGLVVEKPFIVYSGKKIYSPEMEQIYGRAESKCE